MSRSLVAFLLVLLGVSSLTGCGHPAFTATTASRDGDGSGPQAPAGQAQVTGTSPSSVVSGTAAFTLTVTGLYFLPTTTVLWNLSPLTTTYVSSTTLTAQVPATLIAAPTTATITPTPTLSLNFGATFTATVPPLVGNNSFSILKVPVAANDLGWDQANQQLYLAVASTNGSNPNSITALDPTTGTFGSSVSTGSEPSKLALSTDNTYIYASLNSAFSVRRYTLPALQADTTIPLGTSSFGPLVALDVQVDPSISRTIAVSRGVLNISPREVGGIAIYDDAVARPQVAAGAATGAPIIDALAWQTNGTSLYGLDSETGGGLSFMSVNSAGVQLQPGILARVSGSSLQFDVSTGDLYSNSGAVVDPATGAVLGTFPYNTIQGGFTGNTIMVPDGRLNIAYFLGQTTYGGGGIGNYVLEAYSMNHFTFLGAVALNGLGGIPSKIVRWGANGLAILTVGNGGSGSAGVYLIQGAFVTSPAP